MKSIYFTFMLCLLLSGCGTNAPKPEAKTDSREARASSEAIKNEKPDQITKALGPVEAQPKQADLSKVGKKTNKKVTNRTDKKTTATTKRTENKSLDGEKEEKSAQGKEDSLLERVERKYAGSTTVIATVKKVLKLKLLDQERTAEGTLKLQRPGRFRLEFETPERTLAVTDGTTIWSVTFPTDPNFDNTTRVLRTKSAKGLQSQALVAFMLGKGKITTDYKLSESKPQGELTRMTLLPTHPKEELTRIEILIDEKDPEIRELTYWDHLENQTTIEFRDTKFGEPLEARTFIFNVPEGAEVTDYDR